MMTGTDVESSEPSPSLLNTTHHTISEASDPCDTLKSTLWDTQQTLIDLTNEQNAEVTRLRGGTSDRELSDRELRMARWALKRQEEVRSASKASVKITMSTTSESVSELRKTIPVLLKQANRHYTCTACSERERRHINILRCNVQNHRDLAERLEGDIAQWENHQERWRVYLTASGAAADAEQ